VIAHIVKLCGCTQQRGDHVLGVDDVHTGLVHDTQSEMHRMTKSRLEALQNFTRNPTVCMRTARTRAVVENTNRIGVDQADLAGISELPPYNVA